MPAPQINLPSWHPSHSAQDLRNPPSCPLCLPTCQAIVTPLTTQKVAVSLYVRCILDFLLHILSKTLLIFLLNSLHFVGLNIYLHTLCISKRFIVFLFFLTDVRHCLSLTFLLFLKHASSSVAGPLSWLVPAPLSPTRLFS